MQHKKSDYYEVKQIQYKCGRCNCNAYRKTVGFRTCLSYVCKLGFERGGITCLDLAFERGGIVSKIWLRGGGYS